MAQRTTAAAVRVDGETVGAIERGLVVLLGVGPKDDEDVARRLAQRVATLRVFADDAGRMNRDVVAVSGAVLVVSQFTLYADTGRGHRPSFLAAAASEVAERLCEVFTAAVRGHGVQVATGRFGAHMELELVNDGPVTLVLSSGEPAWEADAG